MREKTEEDRKRHFSVMKEKTFHRGVLVKRTLELDDYIERSAMNSFTNNNVANRPYELCYEHSKNGIITEVGLYQMLKGETHPLVWRERSEDTIYDVDMGDFKVDVKYYRAKHRFGVIHTSIPHLEKSRGVIDYLMQGDYIQHDDDYFVTAVLAVDLDLFLRGPDKGDGTLRDTRYRFLEHKQNQVHLDLLPTAFAFNPNCEWMTHER